MTRAGGYDNCNQLIISQIIAGHSKRSDVMNDNRDSNEPEDLFEDDEEIIDLTNIVKADSESEVEQEKDSPGDLTEFDEDVIDLGELVAEVVEDDQLTPYDDEDTVESITVPLTQIETAIEKAVEKIFTEKIEAMVMDIFEKTVKNEIEKIGSLIREITDTKKSDA